MAVQVSAIPPRLQHPELPLTFRREVVPHIFAAIGGARSVSSVSLVGLHGSGKSNLFRFLCDPRIVQHYLSAAPNWLFVYVDGNLFRTYDEAGLCYALLDAIVQAARENKWPDSDLAPLLDATRYYAEYERQMTGLGVLRRVLDIVCRVQGKRVVLAIDGFDEAMFKLDAPILRGLRAVRDNHKQNLSFILGTRTELGRLAARRSKRDWGSGLREFWMLFEHDTFGIKPYGPEDAADLLYRKTGAQDSLSDEQVSLLIKITGGYASLLMAGLDYIRPRRQAPLAGVARGLACDAEVERCCQEIWGDLDDRERAVLAKLAVDERADLSPGDLRFLRAKGLIVGHPPFLFSDLLEAFIKRQVGDLSAAVDIAVPAKSADVSWAIWPPKIRDPEEHILW